MGSIISRTSLLDPDVPVSVHPAPDIRAGLHPLLSVYNRDKIHAQLVNFWSSSCYDSHRCGVGVLVLHLCTLSHNDHMYGFGVLMP